MRQRARSGEVRDTYWDPHLTRTNLAEPVFEDLATSTGLAGLVGAGRVVCTVDDERFILRYLLARARVVGGMPLLDLTHGEHAREARALREGEAINFSWNSGDSWWGAKTHVASVDSDTASLVFPNTVYRFPVRHGMWGSVEGLAKLFEGFDVSLEDTSAMQPINHGRRIFEVMTSAIEQATPCLLLLKTAEAAFSGYLVPGPKGLPKIQEQVASRPIEFRLAGTDAVGLSWRRGVRMSVTTLVAGMTVGFETMSRGGEDDRVEIRWPKSMWRRHRRVLPRVPLGNSGRLHVRLPIMGPLGVVSGVAKPFRVIDLSAGGVGLVLDRKASGQLAAEALDAELVLYDKLVFPMQLDVVNRVPFGERHTRLCCRFVGLDAKQRRAVEVLCQKLSGPQNS